jgi:tRNA dimethylallyltransferase
MTRKPVLIISGPTATGKSSLAVELAKSFANQIEIVNFDSLLFYTELVIGSAKPTSIELKEVPHHLVDIRSIRDPINAADFRQRALEAVDDIHQRDKIPLLVGGSAFYLRALIKGMYDAVSIDSALQREIQAEYREQGIGPCLEYLKIHDPASLSQLHENDHYRLLRAYEYHRQTGAPLSVERANKEELRPYDFSINSVPDWELFHLYLNIEPQEHWPIIQLRTQQMLEAGLLDEVNSLLAQGFSGSEKPLQSIGYKECIEAIQAGGQIDAEQLLDSIHISTRQLAKSQRTFFNKIVPKHTFHPIKQRAELLGFVQPWIMSFLRAPENS